MKYSIRNILGYTTVVCIVLAILRRPLLYLINSGELDLLAHAIFSPYYGDLWLLQLEWLWPFIDTFNKRIETFSWIHFIAFCLQLLSGALSVVLHILLFSYIFTKVKEFFFK